MREPRLTPPLRPPPPVKREPWPRPRRASQSAAVGPPRPLCALEENRQGDWWVKVLGMLQHNWALIETKDKGVTVYFFHDLGTTVGSMGPYKLSQLRNRCAIIDSLDFESSEAAIEALDANGFNRLVDYPGPWDGSQPHGNFYDARDHQAGIYSKGDYWV